jgi:hypothetical protein
MRAESEATGPSSSKRAKRVGKPVSARVMPPGMARMAASRAAKALTSGPRRAISGSVGEEAGRSGAEPGREAEERRMEVRRATRVARSAGVARLRWREGLAAIMWEMTPETKGAAALLPKKEVNV